MLPGVLCAPCAPLLLGVCSLSGLVPSPTGRPLPVAKLTITDAARVTGVSRVTLHRYIKAGKLSRSTYGTIDTAELLCIGLVLQPDTVLQSYSLQHDVTPSETPPVTAPDLATLQQLITVLQRELSAAHVREEAAREREALLLQLQQVQQQNQRLLDMPRP